MYVLILLGVSGVAIYHPRQQRPGPNPCDALLCSDHCVASYTSCKGYKCICQDDSLLLNDELTCENSQSNTGTHVHC